MTPSPFPRPFPWQQVAWHERRSYWELAEEDRRDLRESLELEAASLARHTDRSLEDYANSPGTLDGQLVNGDVLAILLPSLRRNPTQGYEALEDPAGRAAVHLNFLGKHLRDRALAHARGEPAMIFMGGQATGKTTGALALGPSARCSTRPIPIPRASPSSWAAFAGPAAAKSTWPTPTAIPKGP